VNLIRILSTGVVLTLLAVPDAAAELKLEFRDGRVTLIARDVSILQILTEWAKIGGTRIVNGERISPTPVTLQIDGLPEREALDVILRSAAGYVAAPRRLGDPGASIYDRILVLSVSSPPPASIRLVPPALPVPQEFAAPPPVVIPPVGDVPGREGSEVPDMPDPPQPFPVTPDVPAVVTPSGSRVPGVVIPVQ